MISAAHGRCARRGAPCGRPSVPLLHALRHALRGRSTEVRGAPRAGGTANPAPDSPQSGELSKHNVRRISSAMRTRIVCLTALALGLSLSAVVAKPVHRPPAHPSAHTAARGPKAIGTFGDWIAATYEQGGHTVCYAFTRAQTSTPSLPHRGGVVLTVTQRPDQRNGVAIEAGFNYAPNAAVTVQVDRTGLDFYTARHDAFARDGKASVAAFRRGARAIARSPGPHGRRITDTFSLKGFSAAYAAVVKACPPPR